MKKLFSALSLLLVLVICLSSFISCDGFTVQAPTAQTPTSSPTAVPTEKITQAPTEIITQKPTETVTQTPTENITQAPVEIVTQDPTESVTQASTENTTQTPAEIVTQDPTESVTQAPTEVITSAPSEQPSEKPSEQPSEKPSEQPSEKPSEKPSETPPAEDCEKHTDADNDGYCDDCSIYVMVEINFYAINDLHGKFFDSDVQPGVDNITTYLKNAVNNKQNTLIFSSGDMWQGSAESGLTRGNIMTEWMNDLDFQFMTIGNHEFDWGAEYISQNLALANFPFLAINIYDSDTNQRAEFCDSSVYVDLGDIQIGFIGAIGDCYSSISGEMSEGYYFLVGEQLTNLVKAESEHLRAQGADIIVYSLHDNTAGCDEALSSGGYVDVVFEGHSHSFYADTDDYGVYHIQGGGDNMGMSYASLNYNTANDNHTVSAEIIYSSVYSAADSDNIVNKLSDKYSDKISIIDDIPGYNEETRDSSYLRNAVAHTYMDLANTRWSNYNVVLGGGFISCRAPGQLYSGDVTYGDLYMLFPFDNRLALCSCSGADLLSNYINTSNSNYFVAYTTYGASVKDSIDPDATYYLITDSYNYTFKRNNLTVVEYYDDGVYARDLLADYIETGAFGSRPEIVIPIPNRHYYLNDLVEYTKTLEKNEGTAGSFYTSGKIIEITNTIYGDMIIQDHTGATLVLYGLYAEDGTRYDAMVTPPAVGDTILVYGSMKRYVSTNGVETIEMYKPTIISAPVANDPSNIATIPQIITVAMGLAPGTDSTGEYYISGTIVEITTQIYGNTYIVDESGNIFYIYGLYDAAGNRYDAMPEKPAVGDTVTLHGIIRHYVNNNTGIITFEMVNGKLI